MGRGHYLSLMRRGTGVQLRERALREVEASVHLPLLEEFVREDVEGLRSVKVHVA